MTRIESSPHAVMQGKPRTVERLAAFGDAIWEEMELASPLKTQHHTVDERRRMEAHFLLDYGLEGQHWFRTRLVVKVMLTPEDGFCVAHVEGGGLSLHPELEPPKPSQLYLEAVGQRTEPLLRLVERWNVMATTLQGPPPLPADLVQELEERRALIEQANQRLKELLTRVVHGLASAFDELPDGDGEPGSTTNLNCEPA